MLELLSPAGSMDALRAAVQNGANAVYLGIGTFNARQGAKNFTLETLGEALKYCHVRGVAVHLTLNTLVTDREFKSVAELIRKTAEAGVDAYIVQDLGVAQLCRQIVPFDLNLSAAVLQHLFQQSGDVIGQNHVTILPEGFRTFRSIAHRVSIADLSVRYISFGSSFVFDYP